MPFNLRGLRIYALGLAHRAVRDIQRDHFRSLRYYVDMCAFLSKGQGHRLFFERAQTVLEQSNSLYYPLIQRMISSVDEDTLCTFGVNTGIDALTTGAGQIQALAAGGERKLPWLTLADACTASDDAITAGEERGQYAWCLAAHSASDAAQAVALASRHGKCAFALLLVPDLVTDGLLCRLQQTPNMAVNLMLDSPDLSESAHAALQRLQSARLLYAVSLDVNDNSVRQVLSSEWLDVMAQHAPFCVLTHSRMSREAAQALTKEVYRLRLSTGAPMLPFLWEEDTAYICKSISPAACVQDLRLSAQPG